MAKALRLVNGILRMQTIINDISEAHLRVVASSPGPNEILGPITAGTDVTLPGSITYTDKELNIFFEGQKLIPTIDYTYVGTPPRSQVQFTFDLLVDDVLFFEKER